MSTVKVSVEEEIDKALAALEKACKRFQTKEYREKVKTKGSEEKGGREQQV